MPKRLAGLLMLTPALAFAQGGQPSLTSVVFNPTSVAGGRPATATITLSGPAASNGFEVGLSITSNVAQLASSAITIGSGQSSATVQVQTTPTASAQLAVLTATARGETRTGNLTVSPPPAANLTIAPATVTAGQQATGTITLDGPAPAGGTTVALSSSSNAVTVASTKTISAGQSSTTISLASNSVTASTNATITATAGSNSRSATLAVNPAPISITSIGFPTNPKSGDSVTLTAQASSAAPAGGLIVQFSATGPSSFFGQNLSTLVDTIAAGATSLSHSFTLPRTTSDRVFTITATLNGVTTTRTGTLLAPRIVSIVLVDSIVSGQNALVNASLDAPTSSGITATVTSNNPAVSAPGTTSGFFLSPRTVGYRIETNPVSERTSAIVTVTQLGASRSETIVVLPGPPLLAGISASPVIARAGGSIVLTVRLDRPAPKGITAVQLSATGLPLGMTIPSSVTVPVGASTASVTVQTPSRVVSSTSINVRASLGERFMTVDVRIDP